MKRELTIAEVTNRLGIGGVESHVFRLAEGLVAHGNRVILLTENTGGNTDRVRATGAEVITLPFTAEQRDTAADILSDEAVDLIHAHAYRAARFAAPIARKIDVPYLMTVHGPRPWYKQALFREWSDPVITVSEADKGNITGFFGVAEDRVAVSFLGVDTDRFRPGIDSKALRAEWGIRADAPLIVNVSRFSHRKARPALALVEALPIVRERIPEARVVLVGDGPELPRIEAAAARLASAGDAPAVHAVGARTDIPTVMSAADLVIATATTALEALASATPTIAYGRTGYFGLVTPDNFERARAVCFADHGRGLPPRVTPRRFATDIISLLEDAPGARRRAAEVRSIIVDRYSDRHMVEQVETLYRRAVADPSSEPS